MKRSAAGRRNDRRGVRGRGQIAASVLAAWVILSPGSAHAVPGDLDPTFGDGGWAITEVPGYFQTGDAVLQPDGRIVVIASATGNEMAAWRLQSDGDPDPSFGGDGLATIAFGRTSGAWAAALQPDGKLVLVGYAGRRVAVARLMPNGEPDASFGVGGSTTIPLEEKAAGDDVAIASDGSIVVGVSFVEGRHPYRYAIGAALLRLDPQGTLDATFGSQGIVSFGDRRLGTWPSMIRTRSSSPCWDRSIGLYCVRSSSRGSTRMGWPIPRSVGTGPVGTSSSISINQATSSSIRTGGSFSR